VRLLAVEAMQLPTSDSVTDYRGMQTQVRDILQGEYFMLLRFIFIGTEYKGNSSNHSEKVTINRRPLQRGEIRCSDIREMQLQTTVPQTLWRDADNQPLATTKGGDQM